MSPPVRCGVIGCGVIGPTHVESLQRLAGVEVAWTCDLIEARARQLAAAYRVPQFTGDYRQVLADPAVAVVHVCTDHASHAAISVAALEHGKHVLCEKALSTNHAGLEAMLAAHGRRPDLIFGGVFQHRFDPVFRHLKRLVDDGALGTVLTAAVQVRCRRTAEYYRSGAWRGAWNGEGGGVLINQAIHYIDLLLWLMGGATAVSAACANQTHQGVIEVEDAVAAALRCRNGALGTIEATSSSHLDWEANLLVHGTGGSVEIRNERPLKVAFPDAAVAARVAQELAAGRESAAAAAGKDYYGTGHPAQIADFIAAVRTGRPPFVPAAAARQAVEVVLAVYESARRGTWVAL